jgi:hypothetical protein
MRPQPADRCHERRQSDGGDGQPVGACQDPGQRDRRGGDRDQEEQDGVAPGVLTASDDRLQVVPEGLRGVALGCEGDVR